MSSLSDITIVPVCVECGRQHLGRLTVDRLTDIADEPRHSLQTRILAEIGLTLKMVLEKLKAGSGETS